MPTSGFEATQSIGLLEQVLTPGNITMTEGTSNSQVEGGCFLEDVTPKDLECTQNQLSQMRSRNDLNSRAAKNTFSKWQKCPSWCSFACHIKKNFSSPRALGALFGELRVQHNGRSRLSCNCSEPSSLNVSYRLPQLPAA